MGTFRQPPQPFQGGRQPLEGRRLTPEGVTASADSPASFQWVSVVIPKEESVAYRPQRRFVPIVAAVEETFPFAGAGKLQSAYLSIVGSWQQPWVIPQVRAKLTQQRITLPDNPGSFEPFLATLELEESPAYRPHTLKRLLAQEEAAQVDNPPMGLRPWLDSILRQWEIDWPSQTVRHVVHGEQVDNPPLGLKPWLDTILRQWRIDWPAQNVRHLIQELVSQVDDPPFSGRDLRSTILQAWQPAPPQPQTGRLFVQEETPAQVDEPPYGLKPWLNTVFDTWKTTWDAQQRPKFIPEFVAEVVDNPTSFQWYSVVLSLGESPAYRPVRPRLIQEETPAQVDEPPYGLRRWMTTVRQSWEPAPPQPQARLPKIVFPLEEPPGFGWTAVEVKWPESNAFWMQRRFVVQPFVEPPVNDPPFGLKPWLNTVLDSWLVTWRAQSRPPQVQPFVEPEVNDPPFGLRPWLPTTLKAWEVTWESQVRPPLVPIPEQADEPPYGLKPWLNSILKSWEVTWVAQARPPQVQPFVEPPVDEPPYGLRRWVTVVRQAWEPPPPQPQIRPPKQISPLDEPPGFGWSAVEVEWPKSNAFWMTRRFVVQPFIEPPVNDPPFGLRPWLNTILKSWEVIWTSQARPPQVQPFIEPPVNDPPFGIRPWLLAVRSAWEPGPPDPWKLPDRVVQEGVAVPTVDDDDDDRIRKWEQWTPWLSAAEKEDLQRQLDAINADDAEIMMLVKGLAPMLYRLKRKKKRTLH